jgi:hypothetical protein
MTISEKIKSLASENALDAQAEVDRLANCGVITVEERLGLINEIRAVVGLPKLKVNLDEWREFHTFYGKGFFV